MTLRKKIKILFYQIFAFVNIFYFMHSEGKTTTTRTAKKHDYLEIKRQTPRDLFSLFQKHPWGTTKVSYLCVVPVLSTCLTIIKGQISQKLLCPEPGFLAHGLHTILADLQFKQFLLWVFLSINWHINIIHSWFQT